MRAGDLAGLTESPREGIDRPLAAALAVRGRWWRGRLRLTLEVHGACVGERSRGLELSLRTRGEDTTTTVDLGRPRSLDQPAGRPAVSVFRVDVPGSALAARGRTFFDLSVHVAGDGGTERVRVAAPLQSVLPEPRRGARVYSTVHGNLSVQVVGR
ncbi:hypothetical protein SGUI_1220 [Serinicoccus hydrothermalis]|uniref:Uncharacterized protein n=1 Tax=Serinicoccus hydrothermalis TaxID=1758689 RepID=A0A1B1NB10_9MICO|nr:hypothetical protein [Serinicoccus hydrothermalis]ANS78616.1 hypothetical protein SGUI_1220 [Serinicoccus hydrothermalis]